jgi:hypothetical protein
MSRLVRGHDVQTHNNTLTNLIRGVGERVLFTDGKQTLPIQPKIGIFEQKLASYRKTIVRTLGRHAPVARELFPGFYKGPRFALYTRAVKDLVLTPFRPKDAMLKTFVKAEKANFTLKPDPAPRVIQPRSPRYNVEIGRYLRPVEHKIYNAIDLLFGSPTIMSPYNAFEQANHIRAKWLKFSSPVCIGLDASRFDQHVSAEALRFEHTIYNEIFRSKELRYLLELQIDNRGIAQASDGYFLYNKIGSRMSGDINTSLGNKILMCLMAKAYIDQLSCRVEFVNNGDDCLMILEKRDMYKLSGLKDYFIDFGFNIVTEEPVDIFEQIEFCQTRPIISNGVYRMVRNLKTCMTKDVTAISIGHDIEIFQQMLMSIGDCGLATCADVPVLSSFYKMLKRFGKTPKGDFSERGYNYYYRSSRNAKCPTDVTDDQGRFSFYLSSGITPDAQVSIEEYFDTSVWGDHNQRQLICDLDYLLK